MGGTDKFSELPGTDDAGHSNKFSLKRAASTLHDDVTERNQCDVFIAGDKTGHSLIEVDFSAAKDRPKTEGSSGGEPAGITFYPIGLYAKTNARTSAILYFKCPTRAAGGGGELTPYVRGYLYGAPDQMSPKATGRDLMVVLNSLSRGMARQLGCTSQAALPAQVPKA
ncbi:hypothetical protein [Streptomyces sp. AF1A]|jgi:hypothetical protein|uniref:hypothetical protein n=1 Tax=Streptomyces sp. AF1A TaxID=3394350 RepID=UPI0039BCA71D